MIGAGSRSCAPQTACSLLVLVQLHVQPVYAGAFAPMDRKVLYLALRGCTVQQDRRLPPYALPDTSARRKGHVFRHCALVVLTVHSDPHRKYLARQDTTAQRDQSAKFHALQAVCVRKAHAITRKLCADIFQVRGPVVLLPAVQDTTRGLGQEIRRSVLLASIALQKTRAIRYSARAASTARLDRQSLSLACLVSTVDLGPLVRPRVLQDITALTVRCANNFPVIAAPSVLKMACLRLKTAQLASFALLICRFPATPSDTSAQEQARVQQV